MSPTRIDPEIETHWVGDRENGLAHMILGEIVPSDFSMCGVELIQVSERKASGKPRCSLCREIADGEMEPW
jgi:hypothetical protein